MKFIELKHPEGGVQIINLDHVSSAHYRAAGGEVQKSRLAVELGSAEDSVIVFGEEADRVYRLLSSLFISE
jgi:hypothetical protein